MRGNCIRCCICTRTRPSSLDYLNMLVALDRVGCRYNIGKSGRVTGYIPSTGQQVKVIEATLDTCLNQAKLALLSTWMAETQYLIIDCGWHTISDVYESELALLHMPVEDECVRLTYSVPDTTFLSGILNSPDRATPCFTEYKRIIVKLMEFLKPTAAVIDYEADLLCEELSDASSRVGWGSFIPTAIYNDLSDCDQRNLLDLADDNVNIDNSGYLLFINPLAANGARTVKHCQLEQMLGHVLNRGSQ